MTLRHIKIFLAVCNNDCNTTKAAKELFMTQPSVSLSIKELESHYDIILFDRIGRRLRLSEAGIRFYEYAQNIYSQFEELEFNMHNWDSVGLIRVGASITIGSQFLPDYVSIFEAKYPHMKVKVLIESTSDLEEKVLKNELDFALIEGITKSPYILSEEYMDDYLKVICPANSEFYSGQVLSQDQFKKLTFLLREPGSGTREVFEREISRAGFSVIPLWESSSTAALINAVIKGLGITVLSQRKVADVLKQGRVLALDVDGLNFHRKFKIIRHKEKALSKSAKEFINICHSYIKDETSGKSKYLGD